MLGKIQIEKESAYPCGEVVNAIHSLMEIELPFDVVEVFPNTDTVPGG